MAIIVENIHNHIFDSEVRKAKKRRHNYDFYINFLIVSIGKWKNNYRLGQIIIKSEIIYTFSFKAKRANQKSAYEKTISI